MSPRRYFDTQTLLGRLFFLRLAAMVSLIAILSSILSSALLERADIVATFCAYAVLTLAGLFPYKKTHKQHTLCAHLLLEIIILSVLVYQTGGVSNPAISYLLVLLMLGAYYLPPKWVWGLCVLSIASYSILLSWFIPLQPNMAHAHHHHNHANASFLNWHLVGMWATFVLSAIGLSVLIPPLKMRADQRRAEITKLREQQLKHEQIIGIATLAAGTAHEMGTPLMTMNMLLEDAHTLDAHDCQLLKAQVDFCRNALQRLAETGQQSLLQPPCDMSALDWLNTLLSRWHLSHPNAQYRIDVADQTVLIAHSPLLDQALLNLLDNAAQAGDDPVMIEVKKEADNCLINIYQTSADAALQLAHLGLFNTHKSDGMGLGFYLSNASIEQFGGTVHLYETDDGGTCCAIRLPLSPLSTSQEPQESQEQNTQ